MNVTCLVMVEVPKGVVVYNPEPLSSISMLPPFPIHFPLYHAPILLAHTEK